MPMNDAACDVWSQQFGEDDYERVFVCLFPAAFCRYRWQDYLFENQVDEYRTNPASTDEILIAADWFEKWKNGTQRNSCGWPSNGT